MCGCFHHTCSTYTSLCTPLLCVQDYHTACQVWVFPRFKCFLFLFSRLCLCVSCFSHHFLSLSSLVNHSCVFKPHPELVCMFLTCIPVSVLRSSCVPCVPVIDPHSFYGLSSVFVLLFSFYWNLLVALLLSVFLLSAFLQLAFWIILNFSCHY